MATVIWIILALCCSETEGFGSEPVDILFNPPTSAFWLEVNGTVGASNTLYFATASNIDSYSIFADSGVSQRYLSFTGDKEVQGDTLQASVHVFNSEVDEKSKTIHFVCHAIIQSTQVEKYDRTATCCLISINTSFSHEFTSCVLKAVGDKSISVCHAQARLPTVLWKQKTAPVVSLSYTFFTKSVETYRRGTDNNECHASNNFRHHVFHLLPTATVVRSVPDAIRELGRSLLLQIPRRELKTNEEFMVPVRLKRGDDVSDFTLRCEIPSNSYVEFVRVIWPGGLTSSKHAATDGDVGVNPAASSPVNGDLVDAGGPSGAGSAGLHNVWDVFHRTVLSPKRNVTEIVARFREDLARTSHSTKHTPATEVYKLLFRVNRPTSGSPGRVAPRIFWSLISLSRRNSADRTAGGSPIVTRLNIESSELKHLAMVLKTSALVNLAALTGQPAVYPVWVYGLTHDSQLIDVTQRATCHSGDDAVIHFASDDCTKLGFSGAELDGSPGLPLVAKLDGRSATSTLLVWFPKAPALKLVLDGGDEGMRSVGTDGPALVLKRLSPGPGPISPPFGVPSWPFTGNSNSSSSPASYASSTAASTVVSSADSLGSSSEQVSYQFARVRVLARFILAGSVLYDKDVLGGKTDQYVDVTDFTAHRLRTDEVDWPEGSSTSPKSGQTLEPGRLVMIGRELKHQETTATAINNPAWTSLFNQTRAWSIHAWLVGQRPGRIRVRLAPIDRTRLKAAMPPGLVKQLKDQKSDLVDPTDLESFGDDSLWTGTVKDDPTLDVLVRDDPGVWPVGLSVQIITDFSVILNQVVDQDNSLGSIQSGKLPSSSARFHSVGDPNLYSAEHLMPLYSGLYAVQLQLRAGQLAHSGAVSTSFQDRLRRAASASVRHGRPIEANNRSTVDGQSLPDPNRETGLIMIWLHMSDGTTILWNRLKEISQSLGHTTLPFKLVLDNLRPDLFRVQNQWLEPHSVRRKRNTQSWWESDRMHGRRGSVQHDVTDRGAESTVTRHDIRARAAWTGPTLELLRPGASYSGDVLDVGLLSRSNQVLVPKTRVQAEFLPRNPELAYDPKRPGPDDYGIPRAKFIDPHTPNLVYPIPPGNREETQLPNPIPALPGVLQQIPSNHGYLALKDAPGFRNLAPHQRTGSVDQSSSKLVKGNQLHETSLSDQRGDEKPGAILALADGMGESKPSRVSHLDASSQSGLASGSVSSATEHDLSTTGGSRPALEMSMYILLGLFALVGLVFAVNCGAVVARYRWERVGRRRSAQDEANRAEGPTDSAQPVQTDSGAHGSSDPVGSNEKKSEPTGEGSVRLYSKLLMPFRSKHKPLLHRDTNWVWIGRDKAAETQADSKEGPVIRTLGDHSRSLNSPLLGMSDSAKSAVNQLSTRPQSGSGSRKPGGSSTTAVLSVGEADMLLMHSPYHQDAWQDTLRSTDPEREDLGPLPVGWHYPQIPNAETGPVNLTEAQNSLGMATGSATLGRPVRRHTTGVLTQRNYQGQECSIRIISNPMSQSTSGPHDAPSSGDSVTRDHNQVFRSDSAWAARMADGNHPAPENVSRMGSASASMRRKQLSPQAWIASYGAGDACPAGQAEFEQHDDPMHWSHGLGPYPSPWTTVMMMQQPGLMIPPPNQPAPPIPYGHVRPQDAAYYWEAVMYRSWVRPRPGWQLPPPELECTTTARAAEDKASHTMVSPWNFRDPKSFTPGNPRSNGGPNFSEQAHAAHVLRTLRESREHTFDRRDTAAPPSEVPFPPIRTTSRTAGSQTLEASKTRRKLSLDANPRPLSLPQNFQATNELYGTLAGSESAEHGTELRAGARGPHPDTCPSEESLWWYHPVRRRRKRRHERQSHPAGRPIDGNVDSNATDKPLLESVDPIDYACPAVSDCECDQVAYKSQPVVQPLGLSGKPVTHSNARAAVPPGPINQHNHRHPTTSNLTSASDLAWDRDLLALSHDGLVAYFAGMKESNA